MNIRAAFEYYDAKRELYENIFIDDSNHIFDPNPPEHDTDEYTFKIIDNTSKKIIYSGICNLFGVYNDDMSIWQWAWSLPLTHKSQNYKSINLLQYAFNMDINTNNEKDMYKSAILKSELLNSKLFIENKKIELDKYIALTMYLTKSEWYIETDNYNDNQLVSSSYYIIKTIKKH